MWCWFPTTLSVVCSKCRRTILVDKSFIGHMWMVDIWVICAGIGLVVGLIELPEIGALGLFYPIPFGMMGLIPSVFISILISNWVEAGDNSSRKRSIIIWTAAIVLVFVSIYFGAKLYIKHLEN